VFGQPTLFPLIGPGVERVARIQVHTVLAFPQALPGKIQIDQPEVPVGGKAVNEIVTEGVGESYGLGWPLKSTPPTAQEKR